MGQDQGSGGAAVAGSRDPEQIREEIEETRHALGDTVQALAAKTDIKAQAQRKLESAKASAKQNPAPVAVIVATLLVGMIIRKVRS